jgi:hypothetical protein
MSFAEKIPQFINDLEKEAAKLGRERANIDWGHECDCEFCTRDTSPQDGAEELNQELDNDILACNKMIQSLRRYANLIGQPLEEPAA